MSADPKKPWLKVGRWELGWSRNVALGVCWTKQGWVMVFLFGLSFWRRPGVSR